MNQQQSLRDVLIKTPQNFAAQSMGQKRNQGTGAIQNGNSSGENEGSNFYVSQACFLYEIMEMMSKFQFDVMKLQIGVQQAFAKENPSFVKVDLQTADESATAACNQIKADAKTALVQGVMGLVGTAGSAFALGHEAYKNYKVGGDTKAFQTALKGNFKGDVLQTNELTPNEEGVEMSEFGKTNTDKVGDIKQKILEKAKNDGIKEQDIENRIKDWASGDSSKIEGFLDEKEQNLNKYALEMAKSRRGASGDYDTICKNVNKKMEQIQAEKQQYTQQSNNMVQTLTQATNAASSIAKNSYDTDKAKETADAQKLNARLDVIKQELQQIQSFINSEQQDANQSLQSAASYAQAFGQLVNVHG